MTAMAIAATPAAPAPLLYIQLAFWIDRYFPGYVDAYDGPPALKTQALAGDKPPLDALMLECYQRAGLSAGDARCVMAFSAARQQLEGVTDNQLLLLYRDRAPAAAVAAYGVRYALTTPEGEARSLRFFQDPLSRSYSYNDTLGRQLVAAFLDRAHDRTQAFQRLLAEPLTPTQLRGATTPPG